MPIAHSTESPMSLCSHTQQHGRRPLANGRWTSSAVSNSSLRAALLHRCHWLSHAASGLSLAALRTGSLRAHHTNPVQAHRHHSCITG